MKKIGNILIIVLLIISLIFVSGQEGCEQQQTTQTGIDFTLIDSIGMLTPPDVLEKSQTFKVGVYVENYNDKEMEGIVCVRDNMPDSFYGIPSEGDGDCQNFNVTASEIISSQGGQATQTPGIDKIYFPETGQYVYTGLPELNKPYDAKLFVSMQYQQSSQITGTVTSPDEEQPRMTQEAQPIRVSVAKSIFLAGDNYQINLEINLKNMQNVEIYDPAFAEKDKIYFYADMEPLMLQCTDVNNNPIAGIIEFENEKIIKCFALTSSRTQQSYPLAITLDYGIVLEKEYQFGIKTK